MSGQAKTLTDIEQRLVMDHLVTRGGASLRRDRVLVLLSWRAGLRVCEIAGLDWSDVTDATGRIADTMLVRRTITKGRRHARRVPVHPELKAALELWQAQAPRPSGQIVRLHPNRPPSTNALTIWFWRLYRRAGLEGCSSHSGRRTFITRAARTCTEAGASIEDVRQMAGHAWLSTTAGYIDPSENAKGRLVAML
jgi:integrase/recombinase XerC